MAGSEIFEAAAEALDLGLTSAVSCAGGDINSGWKLGFSDGSQAFLKTRAGAPAEEFEMEAAGLAALGTVDALPVPEVLAVINEPQPGLLLEWIEPGGPLDGSVERVFGEGLARIHAVELESFGELPAGAPSWELHVGPVPLGPEPARDNGEGFGAFYAERLEGLANQAHDLGALDPEGLSVIANLGENIDELAGPPEPPSLTHGDLWSGNVLVSTGGRPWLIDPAVHGAQREMDLAMLALFGSPGANFFESYESVRPLAEGWRERVALWQIQPLLIHAILFGGSWGPSAIRAAMRYL